MNQLFNNKFYTEKELASCGFKSLGKNVKIHQTCNIYGFENISIGDNVRIDSFCNIIASGPINIGSYIHIGSYTHMVGSGGITLEDYSNISQGVRLYTRNDDYSGNHMTNPMIPSQFTGIIQGPIILKKHAIIGSGTIILPNVTIGEGAAIGSLSLVNRTLEPWGIYAGIPAVKIKERSRNLLLLEKEFERIYRKNHNPKVI